MSRQRQFGEIAPLRRIEPAAGPFDRGLRVGVHGVAGKADRRVVIAAHGDRAVFGKRHHRIHGPFGIGAVPDIVAEEHELFGTALARGRETALKAC